jgi:hypothetical protein
MSVATRSRARLARAAVGAVSIAVVAASTVALTGAGTAGATTRSAPARAAAASPTSPDQVGYTSLVRGTVPDGRQVTGSFRPSVSKVDNGVLMVRGRLRAVIHNLDGSATRVTKYRVWMSAQSTNGTPLSSAAARQGAAAAAAPAACPVLNLVLGPLDLNLLGLVVHLDKVVLNIVAQSGAGNLLGNLLCAVAGLLDNAGPLSGLLTQLSNLLNSILAILNA